MTTEARKNDKGKPRTDLLPPWALTEVSAVLEHGARKYSANNWRGLAWSRMTGAVLRHVFAFMAGEDRDKETGLHHLAHAACTLLFLLESQIVKLGADDRRK